MEHVTSGQGCPPGLRCIVVQFFLLHRITIRSSKNFEKRAPSMVLCRIGNFLSFLLFRLLRFMRFFCHFLRRPNHESRTVMHEKVGTVAIALRTESTAWQQFCRVKTRLFEQVLELRVRKFCHLAADELSELSCRDQGVESCDGEKRGVIAMCDAQACLQNSRDAGHIRTAKTKRGRMQCAPTLRLQRGSQVML
jgi:hypothetical protein